MTDLGMEIFQNVNTVTDPPFSFVVFIVVVLMAAPPEKYFAHPLN